MARAWRGWLLVLVVLAAGCVGPSRTSGDYREKAANSAEAMISSLTTAKLATGAALEDKAPSRYLSLVLSESEVDAESISGAFASVQPPGGDEVDQLRSELTSLFDDAVTALGELRIAAYRGDRRALAEAARALPELLQRLQPFLGLTAT